MTSGGASFGSSFVSEQTLGRLGSLTREDADALDAEFNYTFTYRMRPTLVRILLRRDSATGTTWIFVKRR